MCADYMAIYRSLTGNKRRFRRHNSYAGNIVGQATEPA
jgi:hypothetical protein